MNFNYGTTGLRPRGGATGGDIVPKGYKKGQLQQFTPQQMQLFKQLFGNVGPNSYLSRLAQGDEELFGEMEEPTLRQFNELQGNLASRFSGMGSTGARRSSGFQNTMSSAASNLAQDLASRRQGLQRQAIQDLMGLSSDLLGQRPYERFLIEKTKKEPSFLQNFLGGGIRAAGTAAGAYFGGPAGAAAGYQGGDAFANQFNI